MNFRDVSERLGNLQTFFWETFGDAERKCNTFGGHLASIHSEKENSIVIEMAKSGIRLTHNTCCQMTWIGLVRSDYMNFSASKTVKWTWTDGTEVDFLSWYPGGPDNWNNDQGCAALYADPFAEDDNVKFYQKWNDVECSLNLRNYVCKKMTLH
ncbi:unnamed protein product [Cylicocyclus nassatus]|uniref:C-type lectin domain-containing protein n=1 Tax=Cylicocyclus nassatus TaxID=53992 RepID=A0AA36GVQ9_CYLNA|nr:unnamed protein product [Cylicocyclus nassatus]